VRDGKNDPIFGDLHGKFEHVERAVAASRPAAIILLGDIEAQRPLHQELRAVIDKTEVWYIHGNHDANSAEHWAYLTESDLAERNLHGKVVEIDGVRVAGLGGIFSDEIWRPDSVDNEPHYESYADYIKRSEPGQIYTAQLNGQPRKANGGAISSLDCIKAAGKMLKHRTSIFSEDYYQLAMQQADVLVTHEAPFCHPYGFMAIDELACCMKVKKSFHGHQHDNLDYRDKWPVMGFEAYGVGLRGILDLNGVVVKPGERDLQRLSRTGAEGNPTF